MQKKPRIDNKGSPRLPIANVPAQQPHTALPHPEPDHFCFAFSPR
jgi:hypothetical protein